MEGDLLARFGEAERARGLAGETVRARVRMLERFAAHLDDHHRNWARADYTDVEAFIAEIGLRPGGSNRAMGDIDRFYWWARRERLTVVNPTELVARHRQGRHLPRPAPGHQIHPALHNGREVDRLAVALMAYAGLRCLEVAHLQWADIDQQEGWLLVRGGKGGHDRSQPLVADLSRFLAIGEGASPRSHVFVGIGGDPATPKRVSTIVNQHIVRWGGRFTCHQLRHFYGTRLYEQTGDLLIVQAALGHASVGTTQVYAQLRPERVREAVKSVVWH